VGCVDQHGCSPSLTVSVWLLLWCLAAICCCGGCVGTQPRLCLCMCLLLLQDADTLLVCVCVCTSPFALFCYRNEAACSGILQGFDIGGIRCFWLLQLSRCRTRYVAGRTLLLSCRPMPFNVRDATCLFDASPSPVLVFWAVLLMRHTQGAWVC
jgi:hypothetical protein